MTEATRRAGVPLALLAGERDESIGWLRSPLEAAGYALLRERLGRHAIERARGIEPDLVIVDATLPDMAGIEVCQALRSDPRMSSATPVVLLFPEQVTREQRVEAFRAGAWECLEPPHDMEVFLLRIDTYLRGKQESDRTRADGLLDPSTGIYNLQGLARRARELGSEAFRQHASLACVVLAIDVEPRDATAAAPHSKSIIEQCVNALKTAARASDILGRLAPTEFGVLALGTNAAGARRLAERLAQSVQATTGPEREGVDATRPGVRVRGGYEAVGNVGYAPLQPVDLLVRASAAIRTGRLEPGGWLRRGEGDFPSREDDV